MNGLSLAGNSIKLTAVKRRKQKTKWTLADVVDLERWLEKGSVWKRVWRGGVKDELAGLNPNHEKERRRMGFFLMLQKVRGQGDGEGDEIGCRLEAGLRVAEVMMGVVMFFVGIALVRGLLTSFHFMEVDAMGVHHLVEERGFNVWVFWAVTLGVQWLILISSIWGYVFWRKWSGGLSFLQGLLSGGVKVWMQRSLMLHRRKDRGEDQDNEGRVDPALWKNIFNGVGGQIWSWRLTRMLQSGSIGYNVGMMVGLFGCLWFLHVGYFWETSLPQFGETSLHRVTQVMTSPVGGKFVSTEVVELTNTAYRPEFNNDIHQKSHRFSPRVEAQLAWSWFFFFSLAAWGLFPRILIWLSASWMERRMLAEIDFQEARHRSLWRDITRVERGEVLSAPADGVVVLDIGGLEVETETIRPYFLQVLRVNPEARYSLGTLDADGERQALDAACEAALGVVFLVEGWNLSPKQMVIYHQKVRAAIGEDHMIRYLVLGGSDEEVKQWVSFVDGLKDAESEVFNWVP